MPKFPFDASYDEILADPEPFVSSIFECLQSEFLVMPKGQGFVEYPVFERGYEVLKKATTGFSVFSADKIFPRILEVPICLVVLRSMLGFSPSEWAYVATQRTGKAVTEGAARSLDRKVRMDPSKPLTGVGITAVRLRAMVESACQLLVEGIPGTEEGTIHRLDKADTRNGLQGIRALANLGVPYAMLLYERFLGRPFAGHRDSVSELVGDTLELAIEDVLTRAGISKRKTKRAERILGFDQAPDFIVPSEFNPQIIIEAKITEDGGTARDKATRIQHLAELSMAGQSGGISNPA